MISSRMSPHILSEALTFLDAYNITTLLIVTTATIAYMYFKHKFSYWSRVGLKNPPPVPWFGTSLGPIFTAKPLLEVKQHREYGKLYGLYDGFLGTNPTLVCGHPEVLKQITIKYFDSFTNRRKPNTWKSIRYRALTYMRDDEWKNLRKILAPTFTSNKLRKMFEQMKRCTNNLELSIQHEGDQEIDLKRIFSVFTVDVIATCCFSIDLKDYRHPESEMLLSARKFFNVSKLKMVCATGIPKRILQLLGFDINDVDSIQFFARFAQEIINKRRQIALRQRQQKQTGTTTTTTKKQDDFLQILMDAASEFNARAQEQPANKQTSARQQDVNMPKEDQQLMQNGEQVPETGDVGKQQYSEQQLGDLEILAQSMLFLAVGHETTATLLTSCGFFLALYPELQQRLYNEVHSAFLESKGNVTYDSLLELQYLDAFVCEALRYYTPTLTFDREASEDVEVDDGNGFKFVIPKGMGVIIPFYAIHHDPDNYEDPERFDPDRFLPENKHKINPCTFIPFGSGPRFCLASRFALMEAKLALAHLVNKFKFVKSEGTIWPPKFRHHYMLMQMEWPKIKFVARSKSDCDGEQSEYISVDQAQMAA